MHNKKQELASCACIVIWTAIILLVLNLSNQVLWLIGTGIAQTVVLLGIYLKYDDENNPTNVDDEFGPPKQWTIRVGPLNWKRANLVDSVLISNQREMAFLEFPISYNRMGPPANFETVRFTRYAGLYRASK